jgi:arylformamidase
MEKPSGTQSAMVDLSHTVEDGMVTYKGLPAPTICDYLSREESRRHYAEGTEFHIGKIEMVANTGTYVDAPFHRYADGKDLSELSLSSLADLEADRGHLDEGFACLYHPLIVLAQASVPY